MFGKYAKLWAAAVVLSIFVILASFILLVFVPLSEEQKHIVEAADFAAIAVLFIDLAAAYLKAEDKKRFLQENWLLIISFLPFGSIARVFRSIRFVTRSKLSSVFHIIAHGARLGRIFRPFMILLAKTRERIKRALKLK